MPTYEYQCISCHEQFELSRPMSEASVPRFLPRLWQ